MIFSIVMAYASIVSSTVAWVAAAYAYRVNHPHMRPVWLWAPQLTWALVATSALTAALVISTP